MKTATLILGFLISVSAFADMHQNSLKFTPAAIVDFPVNVKVSDSFTPVPGRNALSAVGKGLGSELTAGTAGDKGGAYQPVSLPMQKGPETAAPTAPKPGSAETPPTEATAAAAQDPAAAVQAAVAQAQIRDLNDRIDKLEAQKQPDAAAIAKLTKQRDALAAISSTEREIETLKADQSIADTAKLKQLTLLEKSLKDLQGSTDPDIQAIAKTESGRIATISKNVTEELKTVTEKINADKDTASAAARKAYQSVPTSFSDSL